MIKKALNGNIRDVILLGCAAVIIIFSAVSAVVYAGNSCRRPVEVNPGEIGLTDYTASGVYVPDSADEMLRTEAENIVAAMSNEIKVGQLLLIRSNGMSLDRFAKMAAECHVGGVVLFGNDVEGHTADTMKGYISTLQNACGGKLLVCVDEEGGTVVRLSANKNLRSARFRSPQAIYAAGGMEAIRSDTAEKCEFLKGFGVNVNFAPVADVVTNSRGFLYKRAFGIGAQETAQYVHEVVSVMEEHGMGSSIKHFPGYGNASGDTHNGLVVLDTPEAEIRSRDLLPFVSGIAAGADSVMVTHTIVSAIDPVNPATLSPAVISVLRSDLGFDGVIISDAMDMGAISEYTGGKDACVAGFCAGLDMLCTPANAKTAYNALLGAVQDGTISQERLDESVTRIVMWKLSLGIYEMDG